MPATAGIGLVPEAEIEKVVQVLADILDKAIQDKQGWPDQQHEEQQHQRGHDIEFRQALDPLIQPRHHRYGCQGRDAGNKQDLHQAGFRYPEQVLQAGIDLAGPQAERGGHPEQGRHGGQGVDGMSPATVDTLPQQGIKHGPDTQGLFAIKGKIGQGQSHQGIDAPGVQPPVQEGGLDGIFRGGSGTGFCPVWRRDQVIHGLSHAVEQQADPHPGTEQHGKPAGPAEFRSGIVPTKADIAEGADDEIEHKTEDEVHPQHKKPAGLVGDPGLGLIKGRAELF